MPTTIYAKRHSHMLDHSHTHPQAQNRRTNWLHKLLSCFWTFCLPHYRLTTTSVVGTVRNSRCRNRGCREGEGLKQKTALVLSAFADTDKRRYSPVLIKRTSSHTKLPPQSRSLGVQTTGRSHDFVIGFDKIRSAVYDNDTPLSRYPGRRTDRAFN